MSASRSKRTQSRLAFRSPSEKSLQKDFPTAPHGTIECAMISEVEICTVEEYTEISNILMAQSRSSSSAQKISLAEYVIVCKEEQRHQADAPPTADPTKKSHIPRRIPGFRSSVPTLSKPGSVEPPRPATVESGLVPPPPLIFDDPSVKSICVPLRQSLLKLTCDVQRPPSSSSVAEAARNRPKSSERRLLEKYATSDAAERNIIRAKVASIVNRRKIDSTAERGKREPKKEQPRNQYSSAILDEISSKEFKTKTSQKEPNRLSSPKKDPSKECSAKALVDDNKKMATLKRVVKDLSLLNKGLKRPVSNNKTVAKKSVEDESDRIGSPGQKRLDRLSSPKTNKRYHRSDSSSENSRSRKDEKDANEKLTPTSRKDPESGRLNNAGRKDNWATLSKILLDDFELLRSETNRKKSNEQKRHKSSSVFEEHLSRSDSIAENETKEKKAAVRPHTCPPHRRPSHESTLKKFQSLFGLVECKQPKLHTRSKGNILWICIERPLLDEGPTYSAPKLTPSIYKNLNNVQKTREHKTKAKEERKKTPAPKPPPEKPKSVRKTIPPVGFKRELNVSPKQATIVLPIYGNLPPASPPRPSPSIFKKGQSKFPFLVKQTVGRFQLLNKQKAEEKVAAAASVDLEKKQKSTIELVFTVSKDFDELQKSTTALPLGYSAAPEDKPPPPPPKAAKEPLPVASKSESCLLKEKNGLSEVASPPRTAPAGERKSFLPAVRDRSSQTFSTASSLSQMERKEQVTSTSDESIYGPPPTKETRDKGVGTDEEEAANTSKAQIKKWAQKLAKTERNLRALRERIAGLNNMLKQSNSMLSAEHDVKRAFSEFSNGPTQHKTFRISTSQHERPTQTHVFQERPLTSRKLHPIPDVPALPHRGRPFKPGAAAILSLCNFPSTPSIPVHLLIPPNAIQVPQTAPVLHAREFYLRPKSSQK